jgi:hypothetical protein
MGQCETDRTPAEDQRQKRQNTRECPTTTASAAFFRMLRILRDDTPQCPKTAKPVRNFLESAADAG